MAKLQQLNLSPTDHIILKTSKDELTPGCVSENGQVFLQYVPPHILHQQGKTARRNPGSSLADDTVYSRETVESVFNSSEVESTYTGQETYYDDDERGEEGVGHGLCVQETAVEEEEVIGGDTEVVTLITESNVDSVEGG